MANDQVSSERSNIFRFGIRTPRQLREYCKEVAATEFIVEGLIPKQSLALVVGDSGLGKSPFLYQGAMCVAAGIPFLGREVKPGTVLYLDSENGIAQVDLVVSQLAKHLGLSAPPENLLLWNLNDCTEVWSPAKLIEEAKPSLVIVDPVKVFYPKIESSTDDVQSAYRQLRQIMSTFGCSIVGVHHIRKPSQASGEGPMSLEKANLGDWFLQARGARELINGSDIRIGVDLPSHAQNDNTLVVRGFVRVSGEIPPMRLVKVRDGDGEPQGFRCLAGIELLDNREQEAAFIRLPDKFRFTEAMNAYGRGDQATSDFLSKAIGAGILRKVQRGLYAKIRGTPQRRQELDDLPLVA
jgi:hypothetical protein